MILILWVGAAASLGRVKGRKHAIVRVDARQKQAFPDRGVNKGNDFTSHRRLNGPLLGQEVAFCLSSHLSFFSLILSGVVH